MDFDFTIEQKQLQESARAVIQKELAPWVDAYHKRGTTEPADKADYLAHFQKLLPLGYIDGLIPVKYGGKGLNYVTMGLLVEELAKTGNHGYFTDHLFLTLAIVEFGTEEQKKRFLPVLTSYTKPSTLALTEPNHGSDLGGLETTAVLDGDYYVINGTKTLIGGSGFADFLCTLAVTDKSKGSKGISMFAVEKAVSPWTSKNFHILAGCPAPLAEIYFDNCRVPRNNLIGVEGNGYKQTMKRYEAFRALGSLLYVGLAEGAIELGIQYAKQRKQFGKPIGSFQLVQKLIVDSLIEAEASRCLSYRALSMIDKGIYCRKEASMAKYYAAEMSVKVTRNIMQVFGGIGVTLDSQIARRFAHAAIGPIGGGSNEIQLLSIGREVLGISAIV